MGGKLGQRMRSGQPDVLGGQPGATYWDQRRAWDREVKEALESIGTVGLQLGLAGSGIPFLVLDSFAFHRFTVAATGLTVGAHGWQGGALSDDILCGLQVPVGQTISRVDFETHGDTAGAVVVRITQRGGLPGATVFTQTASAALANTDQTLSITGLSLTQSTGRSTYLQVTFPASGAPTSSMSRVLLFP